MEEDRLLTEEDFVAGNQCDQQDKNRRRKQWRRSSSISEKTIDSEEEEEDGGSNSNGFDCNICLNSVQDPVVTLCGHLYCWPCIYRWLHSGIISAAGDGGETEKPRLHRRDCPVCKAEITQSALIPLFGGRGRASDAASSAGNVIPSRPAAPEQMRRRRRGHSSSPPPPRLPPEWSAIVNSGFSDRVPIPVVGMLEEIVFAGGAFGGRREVYGYPTVPNRVRRQLVEADRSLSRVCFFLCCCVLMCIILF